MKFWEHYGVYNQDHFLRLLYSEKSGILVAQFERISQNGHSLKSLYCRSVTEQMYRNLTDDADTFSYEDPVLSTHDGRVFLNVLKTSTVNQYPAYEWQHVACIDLVDGRRSVLLDNGPTELMSRGEKFTVSRLYGMDEAGTTIISNVVFEHVSVNHELEANYWLCKISVDSGRVEKIASLFETGL